MNEFRRARRRKAQVPIDVIDSMTEQVLGRIANISESGLLLQLLIPGVDDGLFQLRFRLGGREGRWPEIEIGAHQLWSEAKSESGGYGFAGFRLIDIGSEEAANLRNWINEPGSQYA